MKLCLPDFHVLFNRRDVLFFLVRHGGDRERK